MRYSKQREIILKVVLDACDHPSVDTIYERVRLEIPNISLGTVYRNLTILYNEGKIRKIQSPTGKDHYDKTLENHAHLYCQECNKVIDISILISIDLKNEIEDNNKCIIVTSNIMFTGKCKNCLGGK